MCVCTPYDTFFYAKFKKRRVLYPRIGYGIDAEMEKFVTASCPNQLKPFLMVTGKSVMSVYADLNKPLSSRGNWELAGVVLFLIVLSNIIQNVFWLESVILNGVRYGLFFMFILAMRPSVGRKDKEYFFEYLNRFKFALIATILFGIVPRFFPVFAIPLVFLWWMFFLLFLFDSSGSFKAVLRAKAQATKLLVYNLPICIVLEITKGIVGYLLLDKFVGWAIGWGGLTLAIIVFLLVLPIIVALICNFYTKKFHDEPDLYLKQHAG